MPLVCGIYGYEITRPFSVDGLSFVPVFTNLREAEEAAHDLEQYNLTAIVIAEEFPSILLYRLEAALSFIEHLDVKITIPEPVVRPHPHEQFLKQLRISRRHEGGGAFIASDVFFKESRPTFIKKALRYLADDRYCEVTGYGMLFYKTTETFRQRKPFLDVSYFLLFSGVETYVRNTLADIKPKEEVAVLLCRRLRALGFNACIFSPDTPARSMDTYARLRNALFHNGKLVAHRKVSGATQTYRLEDYFAHFMILTGLIVLKATAFDDGHINWNAWLDMQLFK